jgi:acetolactate synthase regulatory subunit
MNAVDKLELRHQARELVKHVIRARGLQVRSFEVKAITDTASKVIEIILVLLPSIKERKDNV